MSIESEITRLQGAKADLKDAIEAKGVTVPSSAKLDDYADYVEDIPTGGGASLETKSASYTPSELAISQTLTPSTGYDGFDKVNVSVGAISSNYVGSTVPRKDSTDLTASGATVTAPSGYYASNATKTIPSVSSADMYGELNSINSSGDVVFDVDINASGYVSSGSVQFTDTGAVSVQGAQTIIPGTTNQTIASGRYLTGAQTILGDANLVASNIVSGVTIFGITGTAQTGGEWVEITIPTDGAVTQALDPYTLYHFTGALTSLTITLNAPSAGQIAHYHFDFLSDTIAPTLTMPNSVLMPDSFAVEASKRYEVDVLNNFGSVITWTA